ncbi:unnamed protein product [Amoebophrya sp. A25]|nr:unnamed protein product [Amoebophrya sp. A25]|eukprot:GSA25T00019609001.1
MFSLLSGVYEYVVQRPERRCLFLGLDNAGKTTVLEQLKAGFGMKSWADLSKLPPTIGFNVAKIHISGVDAIFWDLGGHKNFRIVWQNYFAEVDGIVFVVDSNSTPERIDEARDVLNNVLAHPLITTDIPILILANKQDLRSALSVTEVCARLRTEKLESERKASVYVHGCAALKNDGLADGIKWLLEETLMKPRAPPTVR